MDPLINKKVIGCAVGGAGLGVLFGAAISPVGAAVLGMVGLIGGGLIGTFGDITDFSRQLNVKVIPDESWHAVWNNASKKLEEMEKERYVYVQQSGFRPYETGAKKTRDDYIEAIQSGAEIMSCGRVEIIGEASELLMQECFELPPAQVTAGTDTQQLKKNTNTVFQNVPYTLCNGKLCPMTEEMQLEGLATLANKVIQSNLKSSFFSLKESHSAKKTKIAEIFRGTSNTASDCTGIDKKISDAIKQIMKGSSDKSFKFLTNSSITPAMIYASDHSWEHIKHILPILITSRSFFLIVINSEEAYDHDQKDDTITLDEYVCHCIASIIDALSEKANEQFALLQREGVALAGDNNIICPYPKVVVVGTYTSDEHHTKLKTRTEKIEKWVHYYCTDSVRHNFKAIVVNASGEMKPVADYVQTMMTKFITRDLQIHTPLSWELFRQIFSYLTKNVPFLQLEVVATISSLCDIPTDEFPSVLNFYHEHGAFLYYPDVQYLNKIIIIDPKWLQEKLHMILTPTADLSSPIWKWYNTKGILIAPHCENPEKIEKLHIGLMMLLEKYHLAAPIHINREICDCEGTKYFVPFVLKSKGTSQPLQKKSKLHTAPLHFIFPEVKHLPSGVFTKLSVALASIDPFAIDFKSDMFSNQITYWFETRDKVILSASLTSIYVVVERLRYCGDDYPASNFGSTCQKIFILLTTEIQKLFKTSCPAFCCECLPEELPHYVTISTDTVNTCDTLRCDENKIYTLNAYEQLWLKMAAPSFRDVGKLYESEINKVVESLQPKDQVKLTQALEITAIDPGTDNSEPIIIWWSDTMGAEARKHLMYHLNRLGLVEAAQAIDRGVYCDKIAMEREHKYAVQDIYKKFYADFEKLPNPDDITAKLFSQRVITETETAEINNQKNTCGKNKALLEALGRAIDIDHHQFTIFLNILGEVGTYKPLIDRINAQREQHTGYTIPDAIKDVCCDVYTIRLSENGCIHKDDRHGFSIDFPSGILLPNQSITLTIGVMVYGPFKFPEGLNPISPILWVFGDTNVDLKLLKDAKVILPHYLDIGERDDKEFEIIFMKAPINHYYTFNNKKQKYIFESMGNATLLNDHKAAFSTSHFCSLCLAAKVSESIKEKIDYCMTVFIDTTKRMYTFVVSYCLQTCTETLKKHYNPVNKKTNFNFKCTSSSLTIHCSDVPQWILSLIKGSKIELTDLDIWNVDIDQLKWKEKEGLYFPSFILQFDPVNASTQSSKVLISFPTITRQIELPLLVPTPTASSEHGPNCRASAVQEPELSLMTLLAFPGKSRTFSVAKEVGGNYFSFGVLLLNDTVGTATQAMEDQYQRNAERMNREILIHWLQGKGAQPVAWSTLICVLRKISLHQLADEMENCV